MILKITYTNHGKNNSIGSADDIQEVVEVTLDQVKKVKVNGDYNYLGRHGWLYSLMTPFSSTCTVFIDVDFLGHHIKQTNQEIRWAKAFLLKKFITKLD
jgi:hypothetical protein